MSIDVFIHHSLAICVGFWSECISLAPSLEICIGFLNEHISHVTRIPHPGKKLLDFGVNLSVLSHSQKICVGFWNKCMAHTFFLEIICGMLGVIAVVIIQSLKIYVGFLREFLMHPSPVMGICVGSEGINHNPLPETLW